MRELNENCVYSLEDLTSKEKKQLLERLIALDSAWDGEASRLQLFSSKYLYFSNTYKPNGEWLVCREMYYTNKEIVNAKELFYTLENIQVDCSELTEEQIKEMADVFEKSGYKYYNCKEEALMIDTTVRYNYLQIHDKEIVVYKRDSEKTTITYEKFMELFAEPQQEVTEKPQHYSKGIDTFARMEANCTKEECLAFAKGNIDKYNWREKGQDLEDYKKIISYANWAIKLLQDETIR